MQRLPIRATEILARCAATKVKAGMSEVELDVFWKREESERWDGGNATLIRNATIWTGAQAGAEVLYGDLLLLKGVVKGVGHIPRSKLTQFNLPPALAAQYALEQAYSKFKENLTIVDARGRWLTPGLVDLHSHIGLSSAPSLAGAEDVNSPNGPVLPFLRSIDALNTHDDSRVLALVGGVTSALVLPGSGNAIAGQAVVVKWRKRRGFGPGAMVVEPSPELHISGSAAEYYTNSTPWRYLKQACGEILRQYGTRMDSAWSYRAAYEEARKIKRAQDEYCATAEAGLWSAIEGKEFPENLQWEMLVDVLRGRVKVNNHCYEAVDLDDLVRLTNEFKFPLAAIHHASEAWLVPDLLKQTYGGPSAVAMFATTHRYKRESFRGSEFAPRVLADHGIAVVMKSDHPIVNCRYLVHEAQQAHHFGLAPDLALASVTSTSAAAAGLSHRLGVLREGADADAVLWDAHPLQIGAVPLGVSHFYVPGFKEK
ncbi:hypothetical protein PUNSTDRAFT_134356 [Punctularia strigosozonata HHB-11173 SS5]|uniref:uncharacterized protein n=1 Tax=Punctularia strigosozonata (strain HHB-11173) TaxID=741275 RepID=UPI00044180CD|nr:uncharacterized protein PUNSTDRAFT_134356 [Punctularia strigosozonata HHB-11173 SS5]EIN09191.1 hypothetical protein PUNSTDRAFT_134356 [Punctularia strigosozonata HHB-11173 SS5]